jgi:hypothetical protein
VSKSAKVVLGRVLINWLNLIQSIKSAIPPTSGGKADIAGGPSRADFVAKVGFEVGLTATAAFDGKRTDRFRSRPAAGQH